VRYVLTVISPALDPAIAEEELDGLVLEVLVALSPHNWFAYSSADKVLASGHIAYDLQCWNIASVPPASSATSPAAPAPQPLERSNQNA
jgi:hypothetical protein